MKRVLQAAFVVGVVGAIPGAVLWIALQSPIGGVVFAMFVCTGVLVGAIAGSTEVIRRAARKRRNKKAKDRASVN